MAIGWRSRVTTWLAAWLALLGPTAVDAQPLGVFRWQLQPYCNVVSLAVVREASSFVLSGSDDRCGAPQGAPATGTAAANPDATMSLGLVIVTPTGAAAHVNAVVRLSTVSGTWHDADGHTGPFVFNGAVPGPPLPPPATAAVITSAQLAASLFAGTGTATTVARSDHTHDERYSTPAQTVATIAAAGAAVAGPGVGVPTTLTPQFTFNLIAEQVTTTVPGQLLVTKFVDVRITCGSSVARFYWLTVDGVPLRSSVSQQRALGSIVPAHEVFTGTLIGITDGALPAGTHTIGVEGRCSGTATLTSAFTGALSSSSVTVIP